jgi:hexosaminidase
MEFRASISCSLRAGLIFCLSWGIALPLWGQDFRLAPPVIMAQEHFFEKKCTVGIDFDLPGASIYYTLDGSEPTIQAKKYKKPLTIRKNTCLKAIAVHPDFLNSASVSDEFIQLDASLKPDSIWASGSANEKYDDGGIQTLFDLKKGPANFNMSGWLGFNLPSLTIQMSWNKPKTIKSLGLSYFVETAAWIFPPATFRLIGSEDGTTWKELAVLNTIGLTSKQRAQAYSKIDIVFKKWRFLTLEIKSYGPLPAWHEGKGNPAWFFLDEIVFQ